MHEMALAEGILAVVLDASDGEKIKKISLQVGKLQMVVKESLEFSFQLVSQETPASSAVLEIQEVPASFRCQRCGVESEIDNPPFVCPRCSASDIEMVSGDQVLVDAIEFENGTTIRRLQVDADEILEEHMIEHHHDHGHHHHDHDEE